MEPPPPATQPPLSATTNLNYADSLDSSPRSRNADWDEPLFPSTTTKLRLMCSYGGHIVPRPHDKSLCYVGGDTRIVVVDRHTSLSDLTYRLSKTLLNTTTNKPSFSLKYQLPNEELDSLISITTDEDLDNMIEEYDRLIAAAKPSRLRVFLFPAKPESGASIGSLLENSTKSEDWFLDALNGSNRGFSESSSVNCLLGLDDENDVVGVVSGNGNNSPVKESKGLNSNNSKVGGQDVHSVPDSPMLETTSSFGSTSSSPSQANLPPIRVHVEDQKPAVVVSGGIEEQLGQMSLSNKQEDGGFMVAPAPAMATGLATGFGLPGEYSNRVFSDDERSDQGVSVGFRKPQPQAPQSQPKPIDLASPDSVSSDTSVTNPLSRQRAMIYQDPVVQNSSGGNNRVNLSPVDPKLSDQNSRAQMQQVQDYGYVLSNQFDHQQQQQLNQQIQLQQQQQQQQHHQQQQHQQQQQQQQHQQQQFLQPGTQYMPVTSYYPVYPPQQQPIHPHHPIDQQYPMYYLSTRQAQAYNLPIQQQNYGEAPTSVSSSRPQTPPASAMMAPPAAYATARSVPKPEMSTTMYRTGNTGAPQLVQVPSSQHQPQYTGFSQIHHPSQSVAPTSAATGNYAYEFADPAHAQMFYSQHMAPHLAAQYQTMTSAPAMTRTEASAPLPSDNITQQIRTLQP